MDHYRFFLYQLRQADGLNNQALLKILQATYQNKTIYQGAQEIGKIAELPSNKQQLLTQSWPKIQAQAEQLYDAFQKDFFITFLDNEYSAYLREIYNPPALLFYQGDIALLQTKSLAIIGSRKASAYGLHVTEQLIPSIVAQKITIVSGLARGIDSMAHQLTIQNHGRTIAVLGNGLDETYPPENQRLQQYMSAYQLVVSEYPIGVPPKGYHFPERNRIIAGLCAGVCVVEAKLNSGTNITAQLALESGRDVFAVPGNILEGNSEGCHALISQGAKVVWQAEHILEELGDGPD